MLERSCLHANDFYSLFSFPDLFRCSIVLALFPLCLHCCFQFPHTALINVMFALISCVLARPSPLTPFNTHATLALHLHSCMLIT